MTGTARTTYAGVSAGADRADQTTRRAAVAALLSFLFPGLGQLYNEQRWLALAVALPVLAIIGMVAILYVVAPDALVSRLFDGRFLTGVLALNAVLLLWRLGAIVQAHRRLARFSLRRGGTYATLGLALLTVLMHAVPTVYGVKAIETLEAVSLGGAGGGEGIRDTFYGGPTPSPGSAHAAGEHPDVELGERVNVLLVGLDQLPYREDVLTDTMLIVSLDPTTGESAMLSVPRDLYGAPMPNGRTYDAKLNSLMTEASEDPERYPLGGVGVLKATVSELLGVPIHYFVAINLLGFKDAVDAIGGVDVQVERPVADPLYADEDGRSVGFFIEPGLHHMDGHTALAFVRSRLGPGDDDFSRAARQQQLLEALGRKLTAGNLLTRLPRILDAVRNTVSTDIPSDQIPQLARAIQRVDVSQTEQAVLEPPEYVTPATGPGGAYILVPDLPAIRRLAGELMAD